MDSQEAVWRAVEYGRQNRARSLERLAELLRFRTISSQYADNRAEFEACAAWLVGLLGEMGLKNGQSLLTGGAPLVYAEWLEAGPEAATLLVYGHYDVMPVEPEEEWKHPPFEPFCDEKRIYARGASDDKGQLLAVLNAVEAWLQGAGGLPVNVKVLLEGEEEELSPNLDAALLAYRELLACDGVVVADMGGLDRRVPLVMYGTRGNLAVEVRLRGPAKDLHSGTYGGGVDNPANVLTRLLASLQDPVSRRVQVAGFYDRVKELTPRELALAAAVPITDEAGLYLTGAPALGGEEGYPLKVRVSARPTFDVIGIAGGYAGPGFKTVIPSQAVAKLSFRLVPDQDPGEICAALQAHLAELAPPTVHLEVEALGQTHPLTVDIDHPVVAAARPAFEASFGAAPCFVRGGGSLRIASLFQEQLTPAILLTGFGLPQDCEHAPNESFALDQFYSGTEMMVHYFQECAEAIAKPCQP
jgi:acetylornithine deacetylase/succinyl-diaminopimelate desuccinylase-like protein